MESKNCKWFGPSQGDFRDASVGALFYDFVSKNVAMPSELGELVAYVVLLVISWYTIVFAFRFMLSLVKPVLVVVAALFLFRFLSSFQSAELKDILFEIGNLIANGVSSAVKLFMRILG